MIKQIIGGIPADSVVKNLPANAGDTGSAPDPGRPHVPQSSWAHAPQLRSLSTRAQELQLPSPSAPGPAVSGHAVSGPQSERVTVSGHVVSGHAVSGPRSERVTVSGHPVSGPRGERATVSSHGVSRPQWAATWWAGHSERPAVSSHAVNRPWWAAHSERPLGEQATVRGLQWAGHSEQPHSERAMQWAATRWVGHTVSGPCGEGATRWAGHAVSGPRSEWPMHCNWRGAPLATTRQKPSSNEDQRNRR